MDLTSDTVAASNLIAPNTAHGADGEAIVGTASRPNVVTFTSTYDSNDNLTSITSDKTYAQAYSMYQNSSVDPIPFGALGISQTPYDNGLTALVYNGAYGAYGSDHPYNYLLFTTYFESGAGNDIELWENDTIHVVSPSQFTVSSITLPTSTSSTSSGTSKAVITPSTSVQYLNIPFGKNDTASYYTISAMPTMTLPTSASSSGSGISKATISRSTSNQYINIPTGYNGTASYYTISATPNMTLPTAASSTSSGTSKATITPTTSAQYINIPTGYNGTASYYTISAVTYSTITVSSSNPSGGSNGDIWIKTS